MGYTDLFSVPGKKKKKAVKTNGYVELKDGLYFTDLDEAYLNSPTATMGILKFLQYCVPPNLKQEYQKLWKKVSSDYIKYGPYAIRVSYSIDAVAIDWEYVDVKEYQVKDKDDNGNASTYINTRTGAVYPAFNNNPVVVKSQFVGAGGYEKFVGQIYMYNDSSMPYRITPLYSVLGWMRTEGDASTYVDKASDNAMFGNNVFVMKKSSSATEREIEIINSVKSQISSVKGVAEAAQNLLIEYEGDIDDVAKLLTKVSISNDVDIDLLNGVDDKASEKICMACYGFPIILVKQNEGVFGNNGEALRVAKEQWAATCLDEANNILDGFKEIQFQITDDNGSTDNTNGGTA